MYIKMKGQKYIKAKICIFFLWYDAYVHVYDVNLNEVKNGSYQCKKCNIIKSHLPTQLHDIYDQSITYFFFKKKVY